MDINVKNNLLHKLEIPFVMLSLFAGAAFLTKMCYLSLAFNTLFAIVFLTVFYLYVRARLNVRIPPALLVLVFLALQVDALGNFFRMYGRQFGPMQYDEFSHMMVQVLVTPLIVWCFDRILGEAVTGRSGDRERRGRGRGGDGEKQDISVSPHRPIPPSPPLGYRLPLKLTACFAAMTVFSLSAAYEIIELWDELYFGGKRIWGPYDTATDLQWDLCGIIVGTLFSCIMLRTFQPVYKPALEQS